MHLFCHNCLGLKVYLGSMLSSLLVAGLDIIIGISCLMLGLFNK